MDNYRGAEYNLKKQKFRHIGIAVIVGILLIITIAGFIIFTDIPSLFLATLIIICLVFYSIILFFLIEQIRIAEIEIERIRTIEKYTTIDNPIIHRVEVPSQTIQQVPVPVYIKEKRSVKQGKRYKYVASKDGKKFHYSTSRLSRLIRPKNRIYKDDPNWFLDHGYKPSARTLRRWKTEEKNLYEKFKKSKKSNKSNKKKK